MMGAMVYGILTALLFAMLSGCADKVVYKDPLAELHCEDSMLVGYTSSYLGQKEWMKLVNSFKRDKYNSPYRNHCGDFNPHYCGHRIYSDAQCERICNIYADENKTTTVSESVANPYSCSCYLANCDKDICEIKIDHKFNVIAEKFYNIED